MSDRCRSCRALIEWVMHGVNGTGRPMPIDIATRPDGNLAVVDGRAHRYGPEDERLKRPRRVSHFATCPDAEAWRAR